MIIMTFHFKVTGVNDLTIMIGHKPMSTFSSPSSISASAAMCHCPWIDPTHVCQPHSSNEPTLIGSDIEVKESKAANVQTGMGDLPGHPSHGNEEVRLVAWFAL
jgi:hypothetical protein